ncbi:MAG TPA: hypothetical protein VG650_10495 [Mycobacteriales bacterium]|nr:hypothetical protein [Mycobacteriales bacterium]
MVKAFLSSLDFAPIKPLTCGFIDFEEVGEGSPRDILNGSGRDPYA